MSLWITNVRSSHKPSIRGLKYPSFAVSSIVTVKSPSGSQSVAPLPNRRASNQRHSPRRNRGLASKWILHTSKFGLSASIKIGDKGPHQAFSTLLSSRLQDTVLSQSPARLLMVMLHLHGPAPPAIG